MRGTTYWKVAEDASYFYAASVTWVLPGGLTAHPAWAQSGEIDPIGNDLANRFEVLTQDPQPVQNNLGYLITVKGRRVRVGGGGGGGGGEVVEEDWGSSFTGQAIESFDPSTQETVNGDKKTILGSGAISINGTSSVGQRVDLTHYPFSYFMTVKRGNDPEITILAITQKTAPIVHDALCVGNADELNADGTRKFAPGEYAVKLIVTPGNEGGAGGTVTTIVNLIAFDMDMDADNTAWGNYPNLACGGRGLAEEAAEDTKAVRTFFNWLDPDRDSIPGFADGIDKFGNGQANSCGKFVPMLIDIPSPQSLPNAKYVFKYAASDPNQITRDRDYYFVPEAKYLRIWKKDGDQTRQPQGVQQDGDFFDTNQPYTAAQLGWTPGVATVRLYVEVVRVMDNGQPIPIELEFYPRGFDHAEAVLKESVKIQPYIIEIINPGFDS